MGPVAKGLPSLRLDLRPDAFSDWYRAMARADLHTRIQVALLVSFMLHLLVVVGVTIGIVLLWVKVVTDSLRRRRES